MKIRYIFFILLFMNIGYGQNIMVLETMKITNVEEGQFYYPRFSPDGKNLLFTSANFKGLYYYDLEKNSWTQLNDAAGAGYKPAFSTDGRKVYYRRNEYVRRKRHSSLIEYDIESGIKKIIEERNRHISPIITASDRSLVYKKNSSLQILDLSVQKKMGVSSLDDTIVYIENSAITLHEGSDKKILRPLNKGNYIWPSLSPDKKLILFTVAGRGTYICDLGGKILYSLGRANAPKWSPDGRWIVYMKDEDDGYRFTHSTIHISSIDGEKQFQLTDGVSIDMYPEWSPDSEWITYHSHVGEIYLLHLKYEGD